MQTNPAGRSGQVGQFTRAKLPCWAFPRGSMARPSEDGPQGDDEAEAAQLATKGEGGKQNKDLDTVTDYVEAREMARAARAVRPPRPATVAGSALPACALGGSTCAVCSAVCLLRPTSRADTLGWHCTLPLFLPNWSWPRRVRVTGRVQGATGNGGNARKRRCVRGLARGCGARARARGCDYRPGVRASWCRMCDGMSCLMNDA